MSEAQHLAQSLKRMYFGNQVDVFAPFEVATDGLTAAQAANIPAEKFNSVWAIVNHVWFWQEALHLLLVGQTYSCEALGAPDDSGWPPVNNPSDDSAWHAARQRALDVNSTLADMIENLTDAQLEEKLEAWSGKKHRAIQNIIAHNSYHTAEIICVRHMQGLWLDST